MENENKTDNFWTEPELSEKQKEQVRQLLREELDARRFTVDVKEVEAVEAPSPPRRSQ
jgi:hypothetical protein